MQGTLRSAMSEARDLLPFSWVIAYSRLVACINFFSAANLDEGFCCKFFLSFLFADGSVQGKEREEEGYLYVSATLFCTFFLFSCAVFGARLERRRRPKKVPENAWAASGWMEKWADQENVAVGKGTPFFRPLPPFSPSLFLSLCDDLRKSLKKVFHPS